MGELIRTRITPYVRRRQFISELVSLGAAFLLGLTAAPFGPAAVAAAWMLNIAPYYALAGCILGAALAAHYSSAMAAALMAAAGCVFSLYRRPERGEKLIMLIASQFVMLPFYSMGSLAECMYAICGIAVSVLCCAVIYRTGKALMALASRNLTDMEQALLCVVMALIAIAPGRLSVYGVRVCCILCALGALCAVRARGAAGLVAAVLLGGSCIVALDAVAAAGGLALCALCAAPFFRNRWGCALAFCVSAAVCALTVGGDTLTYIECALAAGICTALPESVFLRFRSTIAAPPRNARALRLLTSRAHDLSQVLKTLALMQNEQGDLCALQLSGAAGALEGMCRDVLEKPRFKLDTGAAACPKQGCTVTGDSMALREAGGAMLIALSDGMGSGEEAHRESAAAVALLGDLIAVGFELTAALACVNRLLIRREATDMYATLDAALIDLVSGEAHFIKHGAPQSYVLREGRLSRISAETLPVGIIESAQPALHELTLAAGDAVVMLTDGASDALGDALEEAVLACLGEDGAQRAAWALLAAAQRCGVQDDMTVIVTKVYC